MGEWEYGTSEYRVWTGGAGEACGQDTVDMRTEILWRDGWDGWDGERFVACDTVVDSGA